MAVTDLDIPGYGRLAEVDRGGSATIYRAWQPTFEREVAVKVISGRVDDTALRRFRRECSAIGGLSGHPNIVTVYEAGTSGDGRPFIVMEYLRGGSLADRVVRQGPLAVADVLRIGVQVAGAVESAHRAGILHRDLKPENILVARLGQPKVADFGLAHVPGGVTTSSGSLGTVVHAAPEVLAGREPTVASDVWSLASTLHTLLAGRPPFDSLADRSLMGTLTRIACEPPPDLRLFGVPDEVCRILEQGLAKAPEARQRDVAQLGRQLQAAQSALGLPVTALPLESTEPEPAGPAPGAGRRHGHRPRLRMALAGMLAVAAVASLALPLVRSGDGPLPALYLDNFDGGQNWYEHDDEGAALAYTGDRYRMVVKRPGQVVLSDTSFRGGTYGEPLTALTDVRVSVRAEASTETAILGLFCRYGPAGDSYQAVLRADGQALLLRVGRGGLVTVARGRAPGPVGRIADVRLDCTGSGPTRLALWVDGALIAEGTDRDGLPPGSVGMLAGASGAPAEVLFDDFVLHGRRLGG